VRRLLTSIVAIVILLSLAAPAALAAEPYVDTGRVVVSLDGPVDVPAGESIDALVVANGDARIGGDVRHVLLVNGTVTASGATIGSLLVVDGTATLLDGTTVTGDVSTLNGTVSQTAGATVVAPVRDLRVDVAALSIALIPLFLLFLLGAALLAIVVGLFVAGIAGRQVRGVESLISREPGPVLLAGILGSFILPAVALVLMVTVIGAPLGLLMLLVVLPATALLGWFVAAVWVGDHVVARLRGSIEPERPYLASAVGIVVLAFAGILPFVSLVATVFGLGAVLLATWRVLRGGSAVAGPAGSPDSPGGTGGRRGPVLWGPDAPATPPPAPTASPVSTGALPVADPEWPTVPPAGSSWPTTAAGGSGPEPVGGAA
jgi:hypothetical protein